MQNYRLGRYNRNASMMIYAGEKVMFLREENMKQIRKLLSNNLTNHLVKF